MYTFFVNVQSSWIRGMFTATFHTLSLRNSFLNWLAQSLSQLLYEKLPNNAAPSLMFVPKLPGVKRSLSWGFKLLEAWSFLLIHRTQSSKWVSPCLSSSAWSMDADRLNFSHACSSQPVKPLDTEVSSSSAGTIRHRELSQTGGTWRECRETLKVQGQLGQVPAPHSTWISFVTAPPPQERTNIQKNCTTSRVVKHWNRRLRKGWTTTPGGI